MKAFKRVLSRLLVMVMVLGCMQWGNAVKADEVVFETAQIAVTQMKIGWNLGNALDSHGAWLSGDDPYVYETAWENPATTQALLDAVKAAGFEAVRVPVTFYQHLEADGTIKEAWLTRLTEVVDAVLAADMYCIINVHHDTGATATAWVQADLAIYEKNKTQYEAIWRQLAEHFRDYDAKLLFEGYNEILDTYNRWDTPTSYESYLAVTQWAQLFVDTVRSTGGNNTWRNLVVTTYSAAVNHEVLSNFTLPTDPVEDHLIVQVHLYEPANFAVIGDWVTNPTQLWSEAGERAVDSYMMLLDTYFVSKGIPVIIGEFAATYKGNDTERAKFATYFVEAAKQYDITPFWWDDGVYGRMGIMNRWTNEWYAPGIRDALIAAANQTEPTLKKEVPVTINEWQRDYQIYAQGAIVAYKGKIYQATAQIWWGRPDVYSVWQQIGIDPDYVAPITDWIQGTYYEKGDHVAYKGAVYVAIKDMWWSETPDSVPQLWARR